MKKLRIGLIASNWRPIPGGEKNVFAPGILVLALADRLVEKGHDVTLFAPKGTKTKAKLIHEGLNSSFDDYRDLLRTDLSLYVMIERGYELLLISKAFEMAKAGHFDLLHAHKLTIEPFFAHFVDTPLLITHHQSYRYTILGITTAADLAKLKKYKESVYYIGISKYMTSEVDLNYAGVVYNGIDDRQFTPNPSVQRNGLLFIGRITPTKGPDTAIKIAHQLGMPLTVIGDRRYGQANEAFWKQIEPNLHQKGIHYKGFVPANKTAPYYQRAKVTLFPIREPEPFGLVMAESMACGTPVIAFDLGSVSELIVNGETGFIVKPGDTKAMMKAAKRLLELSEDKYQVMKKACRLRVQQYFTLDKMVDDYESVYQKVIELHAKRS